jgi:hypothetical protein
VKIAQAGYLCFSLKMRTIENRTIKNHITEIRMSQGPGVLSRGIKE